MVSIYIGNKYKIKPYFLVGYQSNLFTFFQAKTEYSQQRIRLNFKLN